MLSNKTQITRDHLAKLPALRLISVLATGYNVVDIKAARDHGIVVCNVPAYGTDSVSQHVFAMILALANQVDIHARSVADGDWQRSKDYSYSKTPLIELAGKTLGIIGMGNIGQQTGHIAKAFGMHVIYNSRHKKENVQGEYTDMETLFRKSDFISLHCPLTDDNQEFVNAGLLKLMKPTSYLVNTARGQLINEKDLADALNGERIAGAALDVLSKEPPDGDNPLLNARNCMITPHIAWATIEARNRIMDITADNIQAFLNGRPQHVVN